MMLPSATVLPTHPGRRPGLLISEGEEVSYYPSLFVTDVIKDREKIVR